MMKKADLHQKRAAKLKELRAIQSKAKSEKRESLNDEEQAAFDKLASEVEQLDQDIRNAAILDEAERRESGAQPLTPDTGDGFDRECRAFSLTRAIAGALPEEGRHVDAGREREVSQELARRSGTSPQGFLVPWECFLPPRRAEQRVLTVGGGDGANLVQSTVMESEFIDALRPASVATALGARVLTGLVGNIALPRNDALTPAAAWIAEDAALTPADPSFDQVTGLPRHLGLITEVSRRTLLQTTPGIEAILRADFTQKLGAGVDLGALAGTGAPQPTGITGTAGIGTLNSASAAPTWGDIANVMAQVEGADVPMTSLGWALNALVKSKFRTTTKVSGDAGAGFLMDMDGTVGGARAAVTSQLDGGAGSPPADGEAIFGAWDQLIIAFWSNVDILVNPYESTAYKKGNVQIRGLVDADVLVRHARAFTYWQGVGLA